MKKPEPFSIPIPSGTPTERKSFIPYRTVIRNTIPFIRRLRLMILALPALLALLATLLLALPSTGPTEPTLTGATNSPPKSEQTTLTDLPLPAQFSISEAIGRDQSGYHLTPTAAGFRAAFPHQAITADFSPAGLDLHTGGDHWTMSLTAYGYGEHLAPVEPVSPQAEANRLEYRRGPLTEWYQHGPLGLQQGFTLAEKPTSSGPAETDQPPLTLALRLTGPTPRSPGPCARCARPGGVNPPSQRGQAASVSEDGRSLKLGNLNYTGLLAYDAAGRELPAWLELHDDRLLLRVDDRNAAYPVLIDPWLQQAKLTASDSAADDWFGYAVAISDDTIVIGVRNDDGQVADSGSAYVFAKSGNGSVYTKLTASDDTKADRFGSAVTISGDTVVVGAPGDNTQVDFAGSAYVFVKPSGGWTSTSTLTETAKLTTSDGIVNDHFGNAVAVSGDAVVVGASYGYGRIDKSGSAYVFVKPSGGWTSTSTLTETAKLIASDGAGADNFGSAVAISGNTVVVGAAGDDDLGSDSGSAYVFVKPSGGWTSTSTLTETAKLTASDGTKNDGFGQAIAISGDAVFVGAPGNDGQVANSGSAYVFVKPDGGWTSTNIYTAKLITSDGAADDWFGNAVTVSDDTVVVGATYGDGRVAGSGAAYVFVKPSVGWASTNTFAAKLIASDGARPDNFGWAVAVSGDTIIAGAYGKDDKGNNSGAAYIFTYIPSYLYLPIVVKPAVGALTFRNDSGSPVTVTLIGYGTRTFGTGQHTWSDIPAKTYDWEATGTCGGQSGTVGSTQPTTSPNYRAPITIKANQTILLNTEKGGRFSCGG